MKLLWKVTKILLFGLLLIEIALHFYNPFKVTKNGGQIFGRPNAKYEFKDLNNENIDKDFVRTNNSLGFRGSELPESEKTKKIICMGGSSTECFYLKDSNDWPAALDSKFKESSADIWINNVGHENASAADNLNTLKKQVLKLKPNYIFLMCGLDDIGKAPNKSYLIEKSWFNKLYQFLELPRTMNNLINGSKDEPGIHPYTILDLTKAEMLEMNDTQILQRIAMEQPLIANYKKSLQEFADVCKANKINLILVSQVILFGDERDLVSDVNLGKVKTGNTNGRTEALLLKQYNKTTYEIAQQNNLTFINLSASLPKDSRFFYDGFHFTKDGAEMVANKIFYESQELIEK